MYNKRGKKVVVVMVQLFWVGNRVRVGVRIISDMSFRMHPVVSDAMLSPIDIRDCIKPSDNSVVCLLKQGAHEKSWQND
jgi:hypothetical protein